MPDYTQDKGDDGLTDDERRRQKYGLPAEEAPGRRRGKAVKPSAGNSSEASSGTTETSPAQS